ncbi:hypothetical protein [Nonomuraea basaltis]|uniref:hypothetical protein n=1 Tax=Nonomuraea basaltis TaxID=2495887 RepID=UPI00197D9D2F|nr:hypothetical protein [Nonomuraea basaltis]
MPIEFQVGVDVADITRCTAEFARDVVLPEEPASGGSVHDGPAPLRRRLQEAARRAAIARRAVRAARDRAGTR